MKHSSLSKVLVFGIILLFVTASIVSALNTNPSSFMKPINQPPNTPSNPSPPNQATDVFIIIDLFWSGGDPDGDPVTYDVYFEATSSPSKVKSNQSTLSYTSGTLKWDTKYYWKIVAWDNHGLSTEGPVWCFTTIDSSNHPPNKPSTPTGETNGIIGYEWSYTTSTIDPDGDQVYYLWDWGDGNNSGWLGSYYFWEICEAKHTWNVKGNYSIKVKAKDIYNIESSWSDPLPITMPYSYKPILQFLELLFERFPNAFPILRYLLGY